MKPTQISPLRQLKSTKALQKKYGNIGTKSKFKDQNTKRQRIGLSVNAGHVRGGHSFH